ncbi:porin family protein [Belliella sp. R4-6]|uniref:Porin family protein n=1 Tax=Belliella alkalica TaxID=1730871 RepID=A0ABS9V9Y5_9BACT|nr:DUF6089 family protein [Belliella alkalica]MCH7413240.1 porin family protein [Belliella alkalica]
MKKVNFSLLVYSVTLCLLCMLSIVEVKAQQYEIGGGLGVAAYSGDIVRRLDKGRVGLQGTLFGRRNFDNVWSLRAGLSYGRISAADNINPIDPVSEFRNAYFKGNIFEASAVMEYHFLDYLHPQSEHRYSPYGFFGLGFTYFSGRGAFNFDGNDDRGRYSLATPVIPFGIGVKYKITNNWILAMELGFRATFTDFLDRIDSQERFLRTTDNDGNIQPLPDEVRNSIYFGNYSDKDWYYFLGVSISYSINSYKCYAY